jgi:hypothetical protein
MIDSTLLHACKTQEPTHLMWMHAANRPPIHVRNDIALLQLPAPPSTIGVISVSIVWRIMQLGDSPTTCVHVLKKWPFEKLRSPALRILCLFLFFLSSEGTRVWLGVTYQPSGDKADMHTPPCGDESRLTPIRVL